MGYAIIEKKTVSENELRDRIDKAIKFIYYPKHCFSSDGTGEAALLHRRFSQQTNEWWDPSIEITGYGLHLGAWLKQVGMPRRPFTLPLSAFGNGIESQIKGWHSKEPIFVPFEPKSNFSYFFDCGIVVRGLVAAGKVFQNQEYIELAYKIAESMLEFQSGTTYTAILKKEPHETVEQAIPVHFYPKRWSNSFWSHQLKAALAWYLFPALAHHYYRAAGMFEGPPNKVSNSVPSHVDEMDLLHPQAYYCEAMILTDRGYFPHTISLDEQICLQLDTQWLRCDALAQFIRLSILVGGPEAVEPIYHWLLEFQHEDGGFHFSHNRVAKALSPDISVHATIFAVQALVMYQIGKYLTWDNNCLV